MLSRAGLSSQSARAKKKGLFTRVVVHKANTEKIPAQLFWRRNKNRA